MEQTRRVLTLRHEESERLVPLEVPTVVGRSGAYYRYKPADQRGDRLAPEVVERMALLNYITIAQDDGISRTHGVLDPCGERPTVQDLNSTNGTSLNGSKLLAADGGPGPRVPLTHGDVLRFGRQVFKVECWTVAAGDFVKKVTDARRAIVANDRARAERGHRLHEMLTGRKGFQAARAIGWKATLAALADLREQADQDGLVVVAICGEARGGSILLEGEGTGVEALVKGLARIPGRKVLALDVDGDPTVVEQTFASCAFEDMLLLTATGGSVVDEVPIGTLGTAGVDQVKQGLSGVDALKGAHDEAQDGLDALIGADTNVVSVDWLKSYRGRLRVTFGERTKGDDAVLSHSLRLGSTTFRF